MISLTLTKAQLITPLATVAGAIDKKQSLAILSNILLSLSTNQLLLTATDLEMEITACVHCDMELNSAQFTVPAKKFIDIIRSFDEDALPTIQLTPDLVVIKCGRSQFKLSTLPADNFPLAEDEQNEVEFCIARVSLIHLLQSTHFAMAQQDVRAYLNAMLFELDAELITTVTTDGHRMAVCKLPFKQSFSHHRYLLPKKGVQEMLHLLNTVNDDQVSIAAGKNHFKLITKEYSFQSRLIESRFPAYGKAIPRQLDKFVLLDSDVLKRALSRIIILANEKSRAIMLHLQHDALTLIAKNQEQEEAMETLVATTEGEEIKIGINAGYLLDVLNFLSDSQVRISMSTTENSILVESLQNENYQYIIMPMKL